jgi:alpha-1,6-mannosyltransferase
VHIVALKLLAGIALVATALAGRTIANYFRPGGGDLTLLAIGLNPLFLLEGPASGHNDLLMMSWLLLGLACFLRGRQNAGVLLIGLSVGIKYAPLALLPWLIRERCRGRPVAEWWRPALLSSLLMVAPSALAYLPFAKDSHLGYMLHAHTGRGPEAEIRAGDAVWRDWLNEEGCPQPVVAGVLFLRRHGLILLLYVALSIWVLRSQSPAGLLDAWSTLALGLLFCTLGIWYPWYLTWPWTVSLTRWDRWPLYLSFACLVLAIALMWCYSYVW